MSFDLAVWHSDIPLSDNEAEETYLNLCENWPFLEGETPSITAFYRELTAKWPELDSIPEEKVGNFEFCPWSCALSHSGMAVVMACVWPMADHVSELVMDLAHKHGLVCFDPQARRVVLPAKLLANSTNPQNRQSPRVQRTGFLSRLFGRRT